MVVVLLHLNNSDWIENHPLVIWVAYQQNLMNNQDANF